MHSLPPVVWQSHHISGLRMNVFFPPLCAVSMILHSSSKYIERQFEATLASFAE